MALINFKGQKKEITAPNDFNLNQFGYPATLEVASTVKGGFGIRHRNPTQEAYYAALLNKTTGMHLRG